MRFVYWLFMCPYTGTPLTSLLHPTHWAPAPYTGTLLTGLQRLTHWVPAPHSLGSSIPLTGLRHPTPAPHSLRSGAGSSSLHYSLGSSALHRQPTPWAPAPYTGTPLTRLRHPTPAPYTSTPLTTLYWHPTPWALAPYTDTTLTGLRHPLTLCPQVFALCVCACLYVCIQWQDAYHKIHSSSNIRKSALCQRADQQNRWSLVSLPL